MEQVQIVAGSVAGMIFASGSLNMLIKAWRTKDLRSYSLGFLLLNNVGNLFYWLYVASLPLGPIWLMHTFYTITMLLMLTWYFLYRPRSATRGQVTGKFQRILTGMRVKVRGTRKRHQFKSTETQTHLRATSSDLLARPC